MAVRIIIGLAATVIALAIAGRRVSFLYRLARRGQPDPGRVESVKKNIAGDIKLQLVEVFGQRKLLKWTLPGAAHAAVMWAFFILASVYLEAYGALFDKGFHIPIIGKWGILGFLQDFIACACFLGLVTFAIIRIKNAPSRLDRKSRFAGFTPRRRLAHPVHDFQRPLDDDVLPRLVGERGELPVQRLGVRLAHARRRSCIRSATPNCWRPSGCCCTSV